MRVDEGSVIRTACPPVLFPGPRRHLHGEGATPVPVLAIPRRARAICWRVVAGPAGCPSTVTGMTIPASSYLFQAQSFVSAEDKLQWETTLRTARGCEQSREPYPEHVQAMARVAYQLLEIDAPEVAAEYGPPNV